MDQRSMLLVLVVLAVPLLAYIAYRQLKWFNSPDGERYLKRRMQGPFVPLSAEEIAEDEARKSKTPVRPQ